MKESIDLSLSILQLYFWLPNKEYEWCDVNIYLHFPEAGINKDGPSAGIAILIALISSLYQIKVKSKLAMTGEITLNA